MTPPLPSGVPEAPRDLAESEFSRILRELHSTDPTVMAAVFVDFEGECVDYCSSLEPFDAKVCAAQMVVLVSDATARLGKAGLGVVQELTMHCDEQDILCRRVNDDYLMVVVLTPGEHSRALLEAIDRTARALRRESMFDVPAWEPRPGIVHVETKDNPVWGYSPTAIVERGLRVSVADVLGKWDDDGQVCFRVRMEDDRELTLAHDPVEALWTVLLGVGG